MEIEAFLVTTEADLDHIMDEDGRCKHAMAVVYITEVPELAEKLRKKKVPFLYVEEPGEAKSCIGGAAFVFQGKLDYEAGQKECYGLDREYLLRVWQRHFHLPWTIAETKRLLIRESVMDDLPALMGIYSHEKENPDVVPFSEQPEGELQAYIDRWYPLYGYGLWSLVEKASGQVIGRAGLGECAKGIELSYLIDGTYRRRGYALEAAGAILQYAEEELGAEEIYLRTSDKNAASLSLAHRLCFRECGSEDGKRLFQLFL